MISKIWVDYENLAEGDIVHTLIDFVEGEAVLGEGIETFDVHGNTCPGVVVFIERERIVYVQLDKSKFSGTGNVD